MIRLPHPDKIAQHILSSYAHLSPETQRGLAAAIARALTVDLHQVNDELQQLLGNQNMELRQAIELLLHPKK